MSNKQQILAFALSSGYFWGWVWLFKWGVIVDCKGEGVHQNSMLVHKASRGLKLLGVALGLCLELFNITKGSVALKCKIAKLIEKSNQN